MRQKCAKLEAEKGTAVGGPSGSTLPAEDQSHPNPDLKLKLTALEKREKRLKTYLLGEGEDEVVSKRLADVQAEMAAIRTQMQLGKDPATIVQETTKLIQSMGKELADLEKSSIRRERPCSQLRRVGGQPAVKSSIKRTRSSNRKSGSKKHSTADPYRRHRSSTWGLPNDLHGHGRYCEDVGRQGPVQK